MAAAVPAPLLAHGAGRRARVPPVIFEIALGILLGPAAAVPGAGVGEPVTERVRYRRTARAVTARGPGCQALSVGPCEAPGRRAAQPCCSRAVPDGRSRTPARRCSTWKSA